MSAVDESENLLEHLPERINPNGWRVICNPTRQPDPSADELKDLIRTIQKEQRAPGRRMVDETEPPAAA
jgi:hypothetical protein